MRSPGSPTAQRGPADTPGPASIYPLADGSAGVRRAGPRLNLSSRRRGRQAHAGRRDYGEPRAGVPARRPTWELKMRIAMANDHAGYSLKLEVKQQLEATGHEVVDFGTHDENACDLPDYAYPAALAIGRGEVDRGIFVDGVGYGSAMIANKVAGVFAAVCQDPFCAGLARSHSNTNALCLGGKIIGSAIALEIVRVWMATDYLGGPGGEEKYRRRVDKVTDISTRHLRPLTEIS